MSIVFEALLIEIGSRKVIKIPLKVSTELPSRGMVMIQGKINDVDFLAPLEPDGKGSHWFEVVDSLREKAGIIVGHTVYLEIEPISEWIEPEIPEDILDAFVKSNVLNQWNTVTSKAKWEWIRWIRSTNNPVTRQKRKEVACSKLQKGDKRPCCFDGTRCTIQDISKSGVLIE